MKAVLCFVEVEEIHALFAYPYMIAGKQTCNSSFCERNESNVLVLKMKDYDERQHNYA